MDLKQEIYNKIASKKHDFKNVSILFELKICIKAISEENINLSKLSNIKHLSSQENDKLKNTYIKLKELNRQKETYLNVVINNLDRFKYYI